MINIKFSPFSHVKTTKNIRSFIIQLLDDFIKCPMTQETGIRILDRIEEYFKYHESYGNIDPEFADAMVHFVVSTISINDIPLKRLIEGTHYENY